MRFKSKDIILKININLDTCNDHDTLPRSHRKLRHREQHLLQMETISPTSISINSPFPTTIVYFSGFERRSTKALHVDEYKGGTSHNPM